MSATTYALNSARALGDWVRQELGTTHPDNKHIARVITRETDRWFNNDLQPGEIAALAQEPARTGDPRWDALLEGVVAYRMHLNGQSAPTWCQRTLLDEGWDPYATDQVGDLGWRLLDTLETPAELLHKGVTLSYRALELV